MHSSASLNSVIYLLEANNWRCYKSDAKTFFKCFIHSLLSSTVAAQVVERNIQCFRSLSTNAACSAEYCWDIFFFLSLSLTSRTTYVRCIQQTLQVLFWLKSVIHAQSLLHLPLPRPTSQDNCHKNKYGEDTVLLTIYCIIDYCIFIGYVHAPT